MEGNSVFFPNLALNSTVTSQTFAVVDKITQCVLVLCPKKLQDESWDADVKEAGDHLEALRPLGFYPNPQPGDPLKRRRKRNKAKASPKKGGRKAKDPEMRGTFNHLSRGVSTDGGQVVSP